MENVKCFGQTRTTGRIWSLLVVLLLWHSGASALDYYWTNSGQGASVKYSSATFSCDGYVSHLSKANPNYTYRKKSLTRHSDSFFYCTVEGLNASGSVAVTQTADIVRSGDSCPAGYTFNSSTGACDPPQEDPCLPTTGNKIGHRHKLGDILLGTIATTPPPPSVCHSQCRYSDPELAGKPFRFVSGDPAGAWGDFSYFGDGVTCTGGETEADAPSENKPSTDKENKCTNKVCLTADEEGNCQQYTYSCTATEKHTDPGNMDCDFGDFNGKAVCVPNSPPPKMTEKEVKTDVEVKENADGSKDTTTTTTTNTTNCSGVGACSTTTTTNVTNSKTNADGSDGGEISTCTGPDCKDSSGKSQNDEKEEEESESKVSGDSACAAPPACIGDAIQCAILRQSHTQRCNDEKFQEVDAEKLTQEVAAGFEASEFKPFSDGEKSVFDMNNVLDTSSTIGGSGCPALPVMSITIKGQTKTFSFSEALGELCKYAGWFSFLLVAFTGRRSIEIIVGGLK
ncbi:hypothetical protein ACGFZ6_23290 [Stutzerimonas stutzeri]|uniref:hypothetical protein n=1 Tax=Stutzerimonas stutzeri TaxID=316 RepID=UPI003714BF48